MPGIRESSMVRYVHYVTGSRFVLAAVLAGALGVGLSGVGKAGLGQGSVALGPGGGPGTATVGSIPYNGVEHFAEGAGVNRNGPGAPAQCIALGKCISPLPVLAVTASVDAQQIAENVIESRAAAFSANSASSGEALTTIQAYEHAVASAILAQLLYDSGVRDGFTVSEESARQESERQIAIWNSGPAADRPELPNGQSVESYFRSADVMRFWRYYGTINQEKHKLLGADFRGNDAAPVLGPWLQSQLPSHQIKVTGLPAFSFADNLGHVSP